MNISNKLTILRVILVIIMFPIPYIMGTEATIGNTGISVSMLIVTILFAIASYTDHLDGKLARKNNWITNFGKFMDPLADKILVIAAMLMLLDFGRIPAWIPLIVVFREFAVSGYRFMAATENQVIPASKGGKWKTATQMVGLIIMLISPYGFFAKNIPSMTWHIISIIGSIMLVISTILTITSGWDYLKHSKELLSDM